MSHRAKEKQARREERLRLEEQVRQNEARQRKIRRGGYAAVGLIAVVLVALSVVRGGSSGAPVGEVAEGEGIGAEVGNKAPEFELTDAVADKPVTLSSLAGERTLLFFSEGVNCQACMVQAADLEKDKALTKAGIKLVSVSTDNTDDLKQAAEQYGIKTPMLADPTTEMSAAYGMLGHGGMGHPNLDGHAFILLDANGKVVWHQAYQEMYVEPDRLLADMKDRA